MSFCLDPRLETDTLPIGDLLLCRVRLMNDARFPWLILVPRKPGLREFTDLAVTERAILMEEITAASNALQAATGAQKLNVGALGNKVAQLHVHVVARFESDAVWPAPVWGQGVAVPYAEAAAQALAAQITARMGFV